MPDGSSSTPSSGDPAASAEGAVSARGSIFDRHTVRVVITLLAFIAAGAFVYLAWHVFVIFIFAIFLAYLLAPAVRWVEARHQLSKGSRSRAILLVYLGLGACLGLVLLVAGPYLAQEGRRFSQALPTLVNDLSTGKIAWQIGSKRGWSYETQHYLEQSLANHQDQIAAWGRKAGTYAAHIAANAVWIVLIPILAIFFLRDGEKFAESLIEAVERRQQRRFLRGFFAEMDEMLAHYIRAQLTLAALSGIAYSIVLSIIRLPYGIVLGLISGILEFIPVVGPLAAAFMNVAVGLVTDFHHTGLLIVFLLVWRLIQDYVNSPRIMGSRLELHPLAVLFGVLAGGEVAGVIGVFLSVPIMATLRIFWRRYHAYNVLQAEMSPAASKKEICVPD